MALEHDRPMNWTAPLLVLVGIWLVCQTLAGDLPGRILSWAQQPSSSGSSSAGGAATPKATPKAQPVVPPTRDPDSRL